MPVDDVIVRGGPVAVPLDYVVPTGTEIVPRTVSALLNGAAAGGAFVPVLEVIAPSGAVTAYCARRVDIAAGASVLVSWFPGVAEADDVSASPISAGSISSLTSPGSTINVTDPSGPATLVDLPTTGVAAGTYGDATHTAQVQVNAEGVLTAASQVAISGIAGTGLVKLFDSTLVANAAAIDTGANAIPTGHGDLLVYIITRTADAAATANIQLTINGDAGAHYDLQYIGASSTSQFSGTVIAGANYQLQTHGNGGTASYPGVYCWTIPSYDLTTFFKTGILLGVNLDATAVNMQAIHLVTGWRSTAAINQLKVAGATANLLTGSRMVIYGNQ